MTDTSEIMLKTAYSALDEKQGRNITVIDIRQISPITDYFIIAHGDNTPHIQTLADTVQEKMHQAGFSASSEEGYKEARWILLDYKDIVVNVFSRDDRSWFDLERIWRDGKIVDMTAAE